MHTLFAKEDVVDGLTYVIDHSLELGVDKNRASAMCPSRVRWCWRGLCQASDGLTLLCRIHLAAPFRNHFAGRVGWRSFGCAGVIVGALGARAPKLRHAKFSKNKEHQT